MGQECCYCDKENTTHNVNRWTSHVHSCVKMPADIRAQIQAAPTNVQSVQQTSKIDAPTTVTVAATIPTPNLVTNGYNNMVKVHVSKDFMKFNAAHFIAFKVRCL